MRSYYSVLGINENASEDEIQKAYRKLAKKYHPDINSDKDSAKKMQEINEAYEILTNKRKPNEPPRPATDPFDIFRNIRNSGFRIYDLHINLPVEVTLEDIYNKKQVPIKYKRNITCDTCNGYCVTVNNKPCPACSGRGYYEHEENFNIDASNLRKSMVHNISGMGHYLPGGVFSGELRLNIIIKPHDYIIQNNDLYREVNVHYEDAINGIEINYKHLDGKEYQVKIPAGSNTGKILRMSNMGLPVMYGARGNLYFKMLVYIDYERLKKHE